MLGGFLWCWLCYDSWSESCLQVYLSSADSSICIHVILQLIVQEKVNMQLTNFKWRKVNVYVPSTSTLKVFYSRRKMSYDGSSVYLLSFLHNKDNISVAYNHRYLLHIISDAIRRNSPYEEHAHSMEEVKSKLWSWSTQSHIQPLPKYGIITTAHISLAKTKGNSVVVKNHKHHAINYLQMQKRRKNSTKDKSKWLPTS